MATCTPSHTHVYWLGWHWCSKQVTLLMPPSFKHLHTTCRHETALRMYCLQHHPASDYTLMRPKISIVLLPSLLLLTIMLAWHLLMLLCPPTPLLLPVIPFLLPLFSLNLLVLLMVVLRPRLTVPELRRLSRPDNLLGV